MIFMNEKVGAAIERGIVIAADDGGLYRVASLDRDGIISTPIMAVNANVYNVNDIVYFFLFPDGTGKILCML